MGNGNDNNNNQNKQASASTTDDVAVHNSGGSSKSSLNDISSSSSIHGPLGIDPLRYTEFLFSLLLIWILYLLVPRGLRVTYCGAYPKRYAWSSRIKRKRKQILLQRQGIMMNTNDMTLPTHFVSPPSSIPLKHTPLSGNLSVAAPSTYVSLDPFHIGDINYNNAVTAKTTHRKDQQLKQQDHNLLQIHPRDEIVTFQSPPAAVVHLGTATHTSTHGPVGLPKPLNHPSQDMLLSGTMSTQPSLPPLSNKSGRSTPTNTTSTTTTPSTNLPIPAIQPNLTFNTPSVIFPSNASTIAFHDEIAISTTMQRLRDVGVLVMAHGSKGKPKSVRLSLKENAIVWRTEIIKKSNNHPHEKDKLKLGKEHQVPLTDILYVDVGKQTTALRRMENAYIDESHCFSLLTKEGSLDLESSSMEERDALVSCFSMILDEVHKSIGGEQGSWRDLYRAPSSDLPSSFDEYDMQGPVGGAVGVNSTGGFAEGGSNSHNHVLLEM